jgi:hypothetical protein
MQQARNTLLSLILVTGSLFCSSRNHGAEAATASYASEIVKDVREDKVYLLENIRRKVTKPSEKTLVDALLTEDGPKAANLYRKQLAEYPDPQIDQISRARLAAYDRVVASTSKPVMNAPKPSTQAASGPLQPQATSARKADTISRNTTATIAAKPVLPATAAALVKASALKNTDSVAPQAPAPVTKPIQAKPAATPQTASTATKAPAATTSKPVVGGNYTLQFGSFDSATNANQLAAQLSSSSPASVVEVNGVYKVRLKKTFATRDEANAFGRTLPIESFVVTVQP